jgi:phospholipid/cholesterol/gamma-HCH transport system substrate-binding protein
LKISREIIIGLLTILAIVVGYYGVKFVKGNNPFASGYTLFAEYDDLKSLQVGNPVLLSGKKIGMVQSSDFMAGEKPRIQVQMIITSDFPIPKDSRAVIIGTGLMGGKAVDIKLGKATETIQNEETLIGGLEADMIESVMNGIDPLKAKSEELVVQINKTITEFKQVGENINHFLENAELDKKMDNINALVNSIKRTSSTAQEALLEIKGLSSKVTSEIDGMELKSLSTKIQSLVDNTNKLAVALQTEDGSLNKLMKDPKLYDNLEASSKELELLLEDLRKNPKRYVHFSVFGKKDKTTKQ